MKIVFKEVAQIIEQRLTGIMIFLSTDRTIIHKFGIAAKIITAVCTIMTFFSLPSHNNLMDT